MDWVRRDRIGDIDLLGVLEARKRSKDIMGALVGSMRANMASVIRSVVIMVGCDQLSTIGWSFSPESTSTYDKQAKKHYWEGWRPPQHYS